MSSDFEARVQRTAARLEHGLRGVPAVFREDTWPGRAIRACLENPAFRIALFRLIDVLPTLPTPQAVAAHLAEYFAEGGTLPEAAALDLLPPEAGAAVVRRRVAELERIFTLGSTIQEALPGLEALRRRGFAFSADVLGEAVVSEEEAAEHLDRYRELLEVLGAASSRWPPLPGPGGPPAPGAVPRSAVAAGDSADGIAPGADGVAELPEALRTSSARSAAQLHALQGRLDWGHAPPVNFSVKPSALYSQMRPEALEHSAGQAAERLRPLLRQAAAQEAHLILDMETSDLKGITLELFRRLLSEPEFRDYPHAGVIIQSYRQDSEADLRRLLEWGRTRPGRFTVRLVKGAYWEAEAARAAQNDWPLPVFADKGETDANFERLTRLLLEHHDRVDAACASHNPRSIAFFLETARELRVPAGRVEFQVLYGMADPVQEALRESELPVRVYAPVGAPVPGLAYLIRRLLEVTASDAWLADRYGPQRRGAGRAPVAGEPAALQGGAGAEQATFRNEPPRDWTDEGSRARFAAALAAVRRGFPLSVPLVIGGAERGAAAERSSAEFRSENPNDPAETVAIVAAAGRTEALAAVESARLAFPGWRDAGPRARAALLQRAAAAARRSRDELSALQVYEAGKGWREADGDVCEAIDYLSYYARQALRLAEPQPLSDLPGERSYLAREPRGVAAVIAPWNFPLAISTGMTAAALAAGNTVVYKPSSFTPAVGFAMYRLFREAGLPAGVLNFLPGAGGEIGDVLSGHAEVALVAFTGSREVGQRILSQAASSPGRHVRGVIAELGGKNAIIVDEDADLDEAALHVLASAFGYQGQKCSACSRLILLDGIHDRLVRRLREALESIEIGPAEDPRCLVGAVISDSARRRVLEYVEIGLREARLAARREPPEGPGHRVPLAVFTGVQPQHRIAREEIFGPVLAVLRAGSFEEALTLALDSDYALTGGLFSRSPRHLRQAAAELRVGNLYLNRGITGALVGRHPFGGFRHSGTGSKAGGPDYLLHFLHARTVTENTLRRGFYPPAGSGGALV